MGLSYVLQIISRKILSKTSFALDDKPAFCRILSNYRGRVLCLSGAHIEIIVPNFNLSMLIIKTTPNIVTTIKSVELTISSITISDFTHFCSLLFRFQCMIIKIILCMKSFRHVKGKSLSKLGRGFCCRLAECETQRRSLL